MDETLLRGLYEDSCTQADRQLTLKYFEHLQNTPNAWKLCMKYFTENSKSNSHVLFFCLQILEHHVKTRHPVSSDEDILELRKILTSWFDPSSTNDIMCLEAFVRNKMAQIVSLVFINDYPLKWPSFYMDILCLLGNHQFPSVIDMYLRTLLAIDHEIVDREVIHTHEENVRNTVIKDHMRDTCVPQLVESWLNILSLYEGVNQHLLCLTMTVLGCYVSWIDITLIANDKFITLLLRYLSVPSLREAAATCLHDIISKGMDPLSKLELVNTLVKLLEDNGILVTTKKSDDDDTEFQVKMSYLVNGIGIALINSYQKFIKTDDSTALIVLDSIHHNVPYILRYLTDEDDEVSENIVPFAIQYIGILKHLVNLSDDNRQSLQAILYGIVTKLKYDEGYNFLNPAEEEGLFMEFRSKLRILFDNIAQVDPTLVVTVTQSLLTQYLTSLDKQHFADVEVSLLMFQFIGEHTFEKMFGSSSNSGSPFHTMMTQIMESNLSYYSHSAVLLQYYEAILRQDKFFTTSPHFISPVMEGLLDQRGLRHPSPAVRSRVSYQFLRFVKSTRTQISDISENVLKNIQLLLPSSLDPYANEVFISPNDVLFLYEASGYLIVHSTQTPEGKCELMKSLLTPLLEKFNYYLQQLCTLSTAQEQDHISQFLYYLLSYASRTSKVFINHQSTIQSGCISCYLDALPIVLQGLEVTICRERLQSGVRQYLHRMIICLGDELLKVIPLAVSLLLKDAESHDIQEFIPLINQLISKYKVTIAPFLNEVFVPVLQTILACSNKPFDPQDTEEIRERLNLQKSYYLFINSLCVNGVTEVLANQGVDDVHNVLNTVLDGASSSPDPSVKRICFMSLKKLVEAWTGNSHTPIEGFIDYTYNKILPVCFHVPLQLTFDLSDGQSFLCLGEILGVLKVLVNQRGAEFLLHLQNQYLPSLQIPPEISQEIIIRLQENDMKSLKAYFKAFFNDARTLRTANS